MKAYRGAEVQFHSFLTSERWNRVVNIVPRLLHPRVRAPAPSEWAPESVRTGGEEKQLFPPTGIRTPDHPARSL
jgi:hypothetical protein